MFDIVCIGAATEDIFFFSDDFRVEDQSLSLPWKEKLTVDGLERRLGGGAFNASVAFSRLELETAFFGRVGDDRAGRSVKETLEEEGVSTELLIADLKVKTSTSALLSRGGERTIVMHRGGNDNLLETNPPWDKLFNTKWIFLADLAGTNNDLIFEVVKQIKKRKERKGPTGSNPKRVPKRVKLAYVPGQRELILGKEKLKPVLAVTELLILNFHEAEMILGGELSTEAMLTEFKNLGVEIPVVTRNVEGSFAYDGKKFYHQKVTPEVKIIDRTGAGDAFSSTFTAGIILGKNIPQSLLLAAKNASSVITKIGGTDGLLTLPQLER